MNKVKLRGLYEHKLKNVDITPEVMKKLGFSLEEIEDLIESNVVAPTKKGNYVMRKTFDVAKLITDEEKSIINNKLLELNNQNVVVLNPMSHIQRRIVKKYIKDNENVVALTIGEEGKNRRLFFKKHINNANYDIITLKNDALKAFNQKKYTVAIEKFLLIIQALNMPRAFFYKMLGLSYVKLGMNQEAILYLTIAEETSQYEDKVYDFKDMIKYLQATLPKGNKLDNFIINFEEKINYLKIDNMEEIATLICLNNGNVDVACQNFNLSDEDILMIKLLCARVYYQDGNYVLGDILLKQVEKYPNKSSRVKIIYQETVKNKPFYKNRNDEYAQKLAVILQNKKCY